MKIEYLGHSSFLMTSESGVRFVLDPYTGVGYEMKPVRADFVFCSHFHYDHHYTEAVSGAKVCDRPGSCVCGDVAVTTFSAYHDEAKGRKRGTTLLTVFEENGTRICHMGDIGEKPNAAILGGIGKVNVLMLPVGGTYTVDAAGAAEYVARIRPDTVVPMHYRPQDGTLDIAPPDGFLALAGKENIVYAEEIHAPDPSLKGKTVMLSRR